MKLEILKWFGTAAFILAAYFRAVGPHELDMLCSFIGASSWLIVATISKDKALMTVNGVIVSMMIYGYITH